jgi:small-conductance mechanosensitive channel
VIEKLVTAFQDLLDLVVAATPKVAIGIGLLLLAVIVAKVVEKVLRIILVRVRFDSLVERVGIDKALHRIGLRQQLNQFLPRLVYFLLLLLFAKTGADALGLVAVSEALGSLFGYLPNLIAAVLLVLIGTTAGQFAGRLVAQAGRESGLDFADALGRVVSALIVFVVMVMAVTQLKIDTEIIRLVASLVLAAMALAFGLSFGLGSRDLTRNIMAGFYARKILQPGQNIEFGGQQGTLKAVTATHVLIESRDQTITIANAAFLEQVTRQGAD